MRWPKFRVGRLLVIGGHIQLILSLLGAAGLSVGTALGVGKLLTPTTTWEYLFVVALFAATLPITFPVSAYVLNRGVAWVDEGRKRNLFDDPVETMRKRVDALIIEGQGIADELPPASTKSSNEITHHIERVNHWMTQAGIEVGRDAGKFAARWFPLDRNPEAWLGPEVYGLAQSHSTMKGLLTNLRALREDLPIDKKKWLRVSCSTDIEAGRSLRTFLDAELPEGVDPEKYGVHELEVWASSIHGVLDIDIPDHAHLFASQTYETLPDLDARKQYVSDRVDDLEQIWRSL